MNINKENIFIRPKTYSTCGRKLICDIYFGEKVKCCVDLSNGVIKRVYGKLTFEDENIIDKFLNSSYVECVKNEIQDYLPI